MSVALETLLSSAPYLAELATRHADWFAAARMTPDAALSGVLAEVAAAGRDAPSEDEIGRVLRSAKGRVALLAGVSEVEGRWTTAQSTAALSDLADAALDAGLTVLIRLAATPRLVR